MEDINYKNYTAEREDESDISEFIKTSNAYGVLSKGPNGDERKYLEQVQGYPDRPGSINAMNMLYKHNLRWVIKIAKRYQNRGLSFQDLIQEGSIGLVTGIIKFDINRTYKGKHLALSTYVTFWIRQGITRALANIGRTIRIPINVCAEYTIVQKLYSKFAEDLAGQRPNNEELTALYHQAMLQEREELRQFAVDESKKPPEKRAKKLKKAKLKPKTAEEIAELGRWFGKVDYLDEPNSDDENLTLQDYLQEDESKQPENETETSDDKVKLNLLMSCLEPEEKFFIEFKFGLVDRERDRKQVASINKMSEAEVEKRVNSILKKMRENAEEMGMEMEF